MKLSFSLQADAQAFADSVHSRMIAAVPDYAASAASGNTLAWGAPSQDYDIDGNIIAGSPYSVLVNSRCMNVLTIAEKKAIV